jgi:hypothetical protein
VSQTEKQTNRQERGGRQTARLTETVRGAGSYFKPYTEGDWQKEKNSTKTEGKPDIEDIRSLLFVVDFER